MDASAFDMNRWALDSALGVVVGAVVWGLSKLLRCKAPEPGLKEPGRSARQAIIAVCLSMSILLLLMLPGLLAGKAHTATHQPRTFSLAPQLMLLALYVIPAGVFMRRNKESLQSVGISRTNLWQAAVIGGALAAQTFCPQPGEPAPHLVPFTAMHAKALLFYSLVGFGEEFLFRGYLQTRLVGWLGAVRGWILASVIMALVHLPGRLLQGLGLLEAFSSCVSLISVSLLMGFIMLRTGNLLAPGLFHTFGNWVRVLSGST